MKHPRAFTLIELLVVVVIIAVLIAIIVPVFVRAKESARRTVCLSNVRSHSMAFQGYAIQYNYGLPLGYGLYKQYNYTLYDNNAPWPWYGTGCLYLGGFIKDGRVMFCPSQTFSKHQFNNPDNPWPPGNVADARTRSGYSTRPVANWGDFDSATNLPNARLPKVSELMGKVIFSDVNSSSLFVKQSHAAGVNVITGDFSARWIPLTAFKKQLEMIPEPNFDTAYNELVLSTTTTNSVWGALDSALYP